MPLTFSNPRSIPEGDFSVKAPWLKGVELSPLDRTQLLAVMRLFTPELTESAMLKGDASFFYDEVQSFAECPVEWWDIGDDKPRFQLWLCFGESGYLFDAGTTELRANIIQDDFDIDEMLPEDVRREIAHAAARAVTTAKKSLLATVSFGDDDP